MRRGLEGLVLSDKMDKTRVVQVERKISTPLYGKVQKRRSKIHVHDEKNESRQGDRVEVMETRPLSKTKRFRLVKILEKAQVSATVESVA